MKSLRKHYARLIIFDNKKIYIMEMVQSISFKKLINKKIYLFIKHGMNISLYIDI